MKKYNYFLICPLNFEELLEQELLLKWDLAFPKTDRPSYQIATGGIECELSPNQLKSLSGFLKLPSKILRRLTLNQKCFGEDQLESQVKKIPWKNFNIGPNTKINISSQSSRLYHKKKISEKIQSLFQELKLFDHSPKPEEETPEVLLRLENNRLSISLNQHHKIYHRGLHPLVGRAPMREHIAAACFFLLYHASPKLFSPSFEPKKIRQIIDPFCGSATLLSEAYYFFFNSRVQKFYSSPMDRKNLELLGIDRDPIKVNANKKYFADKTNFSFYQGSITDQSFLVPYENNKIRIVITNPPFFKRLNEKAALKPVLLIQNIMTKYRPDYLCFIYPSKDSFPELMNDYTQVKKAKINFSGIKCYIYIYKYEKIDY